VSRLRAHPWLLVWLTAVWVGLWGSVTAANVLGGLAVAVVLVGALPLESAPRSGLLRPLAVGRFFAAFARDLVRATAQVAVLVVHPRRRLRQAVVAVPVHGASDALLTLLANAISLTPGTLTLEVDRPRSTLFVHAIDVGPGAHGVQRLRSEVLATARLAVLAFGSPAARDALDGTLHESTEVPQ
jgi:multicomponent Na+:H+ antiporter subunit E